MTTLLSPSHDAAAPAIIDADQGIEISHGELRRHVDAAAAQIDRTIDRGLVFLLATNSVDSIVAYLACLACARPVALLDTALTGPRLAGLLDAYRPAGWLAPVTADPPEHAPLEPLFPGSSYGVAARDAGTPAALHPDLALLLTTSGSTGNPKLVRLTGANVLANAHSIASYLGIGPGERAMQSLPMHYSYGLSLVNSHLSRGAALVLSNHSFLRPEFWRGFDAAGCTSFAGVPYAYETLHRLRFDPARHRSLRTMTQAGGALRPELIQAFHDKSAATGCRFFVMYGQTEATARIAYVPSDRLAGKIGSIGVAIPGGELSLAAVEGSGEQELIYRGPNVMMGYAQGSSDLAQGDLLGGTLRTGDLARVDEDGFFHLTGRLARFAKLFGRRVNLEDVERELESQFAVRAAATEIADQLMLHIAPTAGAVAVVGETDVLRHLAGWLGVPQQSLRCRALDQIPMTASGKKDYRALQA